MWRKALLIALVLGVAAAAVSMNLPDAVQTPQAPSLLATAKRASFEVHVTESGVLEAKQSETVSSHIPSNNAKIVYMVPEGTFVTKDEDILIRFDPTPFQEDIQKYQYQVDEAEASVREAEQEIELEKVRAEQERRAAQHAVKLAQLQLDNVLHGEGPVSLEEARNTMVQANAKLVRAKSHVQDLLDLQEEGFVNAQEVAKAEQAADEEESAARLAKLRYETRRDYTYPAEKAKAEAELANAKTEAAQLESTLKHRMSKIQATVERAKATWRSLNERLQTAQNMIQKTVVRAPISGFVVYREAYYSNERRKPQIGDSVWMNQAIIMLPDTSQMVINTKVRETDIDKLRIGQKVNVIVQAYPDPPHTGVVDFIGTLASTDERTNSAAKYFSLRILLNGEDERLRPGMTAQVEILVDKVENELAVPVNAVFREGEKTFCYTATNGEVRKKEVETGSTNNILIAIKQGLREGEQVCLQKPADF